MSNFLVEWEDLYHLLKVRSLVEAENEELALQKFYYTRLQWFKTFPKNVRIIKVVKLLW